MYDRFDEFQKDLTSDLAGYVGSPEYRRSKGMTTLEVGHYRRKLRAEQRRTASSVVPTPTRTRRYAVTTAVSVDSNVILGRSQDLQTIRTRLDSLVIDARILAHKNPDDMAVRLEARALQRLQAAFDQLEADFQVCVDLRQAQMPTLP